MQTDLKGKNALVCGSSKGIGRAIAIELASLGASVTLAARSADLLAEVITELDHSIDQDHDFLVVDLMDAEDLTKKIRALSLSKEIHILVNNSGGPSGGPILEASITDFKDALTAHLFANHQLVGLLAPAMKKAKFGRIINIISTSVKEPIAGLGVSNTTRGAVASWAKTVAMELGPFGITVNNVLPGFTRTERLTDLFKIWADQQGLSIEELEKKYCDFVPLKRIADPSEIGAVAAFLATPAASYITGVSLAVDGGRMKSI